MAAAARDRSWFWQSVSIRASPRRRRLQHREPGAVAHFGDELRFDRFERGRVRGERAARRAPRRLRPRGEGGRVRAQARRRRLLAHQPRGSRVLLALGARRVAPARGRLGRGGGQAGGQLGFLGVQGREAGGDGGQLAVWGEEERGG